jgi:large subunit ribosomal protein L29
MANKRTLELADMSTADLADELDKTHQELLNLRFQYKTHQNTNYARIGILKRDVARVKTLLRERELEESGV